MAASSRGPFQRASPKRHDGQRQQRELGEHGHDRRQRQEQQAPHIRRAPVFPGRVGPPQCTKGGGHVGIDQNAVTQNGWLERAADGKAERDRFAKQLAAPVPQQEDDQQGEEQKREAGVEEQAARADVRTVQDLRADQVRVALLPTVGVAKLRRPQQARNPAANRARERRRIRRLEHILALPVGVCRGEVGGFVDGQTETARLVDEGGRAAHQQKSDCGVPAHDHEIPDLSREVH